MTCKEYAIMYRAPAPPYGPNGAVGLLTIGWGDGRAALFPTPELAMEFLRKLPQYAEGWSMAVVEVEV